MEKTVERHVLFEGAIVTLRRDKAQLINGQVATREVVEHPGGVAILPLYEDGTVSMVRQFRYPFRQVITELPAGKLERGEDHRPAALRELEEEVGCPAGRADLSWACSTPPPAFPAEVLHMYLARGPRAGGVPSRRGRVLGAWSASPLATWWSRWSWPGTMQDAKTVAAGAEGQGFCWGLVRAGAGRREGAMAQDAS